MFLIPKYSLSSHPFLAATNLRLLASLLETFLTLGGRLALELKVKSAVSCSNSGTCILSFKPPNKFLSWVLIAGEDRDSRRLNHLFKVIQLVSGQSGTWGQYVYISTEHAAGHCCQLLMGRLKFQFEMWMDVRWVASWFGGLSFQLKRKRKAPLGNKGIPCSEALKVKPAFC